jgi:hypothetical protein
LDSVDKSNTCQTQCKAGAYRAYDGLCQQCWGRTQLLLHAGIGFFFFEPCTEISNAQAPVRGAAWSKKNPVFSLINKIDMRYLIIPVLGIIIAVYFGDQMPNNIDVESWQNFFTYLKTWSALDRKRHALATLMTVHAFRLICCFPFILITKTMYGYIFGLWHGKSRFIRFSLTVLASDSFRVSGIQCNYYPDNVRERYVIRRLHCTFTFLHQQTFVLLSRLVL